LATPLTPACCTSAGTIATSGPSEGTSCSDFRSSATGSGRSYRLKEALLDGEVVAFDQEGRQDFRGLLAGRGNLHYAAFDALWINGKDLRALPLHRRKRALTRLIWATSTVLSQVFSIEERGRDLFAGAERLDLEGIVAKRKADSYCREAVRYKVKNRGYTQAEGRGDLFHPRRG
jgi:bifunctional non-homologous end joining protein LigD